MKKSTKQLIILLSILVILVAAYITITAVNSHNEKKAAESEVAATVHVGNIGSPSEISFTNAGETLSFILDGETWNYADDKEFPLKQSYLTDIATAVTGLVAARKLEMSESLESYGFNSDSKTLNVKDASGETLSLIFGGSAGAGFYAKEPDADFIYVIEKDIGTLLGNSLYGMIEIEALPKLDESTVESVSLTVDGAELSLEKDTKSETQKVMGTGADGAPAVQDQITYTYTWYYVSGAERTAIKDVVLPEGESAQDYLKTLLDGLSALSITSCADYKPASLDAYGLSSPQVTLSITYKDAPESESTNSLTLLFGSNTPDGGYYAKYASSPCIYTIPEEPYASLREAAGLSNAQ